MPYFYSQYDLQKIHLTKKTLKGLEREILVIIFYFVQS